MLTERTHSGRQRRRLAFFTLFVMLFLLAFEAAAQGDRKRDRDRKKKRDRPPAESPAEGGGPAAESGPSAAVQAAERKLLAYQTAAARRQLEAELTDPGVHELCALGEVLTQEKQYGRALDELRRAAEEAPEAAAPWNVMGQVHEYQKDSGQARSAFSKAAQLAQARTAADARDAEAFYQLGMAQQNLGQFDAAFSSLERARELAPGDARVVYLQGLTRVYQERWSEAVDLLSRALEMNSEIAYAYYYRGQAAGKAGDKSRLVEDLNRFLGMAPDAPEAPLARRVLQSVGA